MSGKYKILTGEIKVSERKLKCILSNWFALTHPRFVAIKKSTIVIKEPEYQNKKEQ